MERLGLLIACNVLTPNMDSLYFEGVMQRTPDLTNHIVHCYQVLQEFLDLAIKDHLLHSNY